MTKYTQHDIELRLQTFAEASYNKYGNHSHYAGYVGTMFEKVFVDLPKCKQAEILVMLSLAINDTAPYLKV
jgi:hypothetical protein